MGRRKQRKSNAASVQAATNAASRLPRVMVPPKDPPTLRQNPRRVLKTYVPLNFTSGGLTYITADDVIDALSSGPQSFKGSYIQLISAQFWGAGGLSGGSAAQTRLHLIHTPSGIDADDRGGLDARPRLGMTFPIAAREIYFRGTPTRLFELTCSPAATVSEALCMVTAVTW